MNHIHKFIPSEKQGYEVCSDCGSYHSTSQIFPDKIYIDEPYFDNSKGRSTPDEQYGNLTETETCGISKTDKVMAYVPNGLNAMEIGCMPGAILQKLCQKGYKYVLGIEPTNRYFEFLLKKAPDAFLGKGYFPDATGGLEDNCFDVIIGTDVFEHWEWTYAFLKEVHRLLRVGGTGIFMSPIIFEEGEYRERDFKADEHCWIYTRKFLDEYLKSIFRIVAWDRWIIGHEIFIVVK